MNAEINDEPFHLTLYCWRRLVPIMFFSFSFQMTVTMTTCRMTIQQMMHFQTCLMNIQQIQSVQLKPQTTLLMTIQRMRNLTVMTSCFNK